MGRTSSSSTPPAWIPDGSSRSASGCAASSASGSVSTSATSASHRLDRSFSRAHSHLDVAALTPDDERLPDLVGDVQRAVGTALPAVLELTGALGRLGTAMHFHLHDGHPLIPGLSDHFSFLTQVPIPFRHDGRSSLSSMYGPAGLADIVNAAVAARAASRVTATLEIHQAEGRLPLGDAATLFRHWRDLTNAERMNYWLAVLAENAMLVVSEVRPVRRELADREAGAEVPVSP